MATLAKAEQELENAVLDPRLFGGLGDKVTAFSSLNPLRYIAEALTQMAETLRDFEMLESAQPLDKATSDIDKKLKPERPPETMTILPCTKEIPGREQLSNSSTWQCDES